MVRRFYKLPSLNALGAFEAAARHSSLSFAAAELNVTPSAVSKHVTFLEQELGVPLFVRGHRTMRLTPEGERLYRSLSESFAGMAAAFEAIRTSRTARTVTIGCTTAFAHAADAHDFSPATDVLLHMARQLFTVPVPSALGRTPRAHRYLQHSLPRAPFPAAHLTVRAWNRLAWPLDRFRMHYRYGCGTRGLALHLARVHHAAAALCRRLEW